MPHTIGKIELPVKTGPAELVPQFNPHYRFPEVWEDVFRDLQAGKNVMLTGHMGVGKTSLIEQLAARMNQGLIRANLNAQMSLADFVGTYIVKNQECLWVDGVLPRAVRNGLWLVLDEIDFAEASILCALNGLLEKGGKLVLKEKDGEIIVPHPEFRICATANTIGRMGKFRHLYQGTNLMNQAFLRRWRTYLVGYPEPIEEIAILKEYFPQLQVEACQVVVEVANLIRRSFEKEEITVPISTAELIDWCELMGRKGSALKAAGPVILNKIPEDDATVIEGIIKRVMGG